MSTDKKAVQSSKDQKSEQDIEEITRRAVLESLSDEVEDNGEGIFEPKDFDC